MPRYFFDLQDGADIRDEIGREIQDPQNIRAEAVKIISGLLAEEAKESDGLTLILNVRDEHGIDVMMIRIVSQIQHAPTTATALTVRGLEAERLVTKV